MLSSRKTNFIKYQFNKRIKNIVKNHKRLKQQPIKLKSKLFLQPLILKKKIKNNKFTNNFGNNS